VRRAVAVLALVLLSSGAAAADGERMGLSAIGPARAVSHSISASRDTFVLAYAFAPRGTRTAAGEVALVSYRTPCWTARLGFHGMLELEGDEAGLYIPFARSPGIHYWRGVQGFSLGASLDAFARARLPRGSALEGTLTFRHESEHYTGSNDGAGAEDHGLAAHVGDFVMPDVAVRLRLGALELHGRLQAKVFLPERSAYSFGPGADLALRWHLLPRLHLFASAFAEFLWGNGGAYWECDTCGFPDQYLVRGLAGVVFPSGYGDLWLYGSGDVGHRKGLAAFEEEATLGGGARISFF